MKEREESDLLQSMKAARDAEVAEKLHVQVMANVQAVAVVVLVG